MWLTLLESLHLPEVNSQVPFVQEVWIRLNLMPPEGRHEEDVSRSQNTLQTVSSSKEWEPLQIRV